MQTTTLSFDNLHTHGPLLANLLRARHRTFIEQNRWDLPAADGMEFDQYDTPASRWVAVHDELGHILAGVRLTPTTHRCGIYSYMIRDAQLGLLDTIPGDLLSGPAPVDPQIWESSRVFVCDDVPARMRLRVQMQLIGSMVRSAREVGRDQPNRSYPRQRSSPGPSRRVGLRRLGSCAGHRGIAVPWAVTISMQTKMH